MYFLYHLSPFATVHGILFIHGHQCLAERVQTSAERGKDTAVMARLESARGQGRLPRRPGARH